MFNFYQLAVFIYALLTSLFLPGFLFTDAFLPKTPLLVRIPLSFILSLLVSCYLVYYGALGLGFGRETFFFIYTLLNLFTFVYWLIAKRQKNFLFKFQVLKKHRVVLILSLGIYLLFFTALYPAIFKLHDNYFVMGAVNWQDTAMHLGIFESISQGNFPPLAPYFSGHSLGYYYFADFHLGILENLWGSFFPRILVVVNPFFPAIFFLAAYGLAFQFVKEKKTALISAFMALFGGGFIFIRFFEDAGKLFMGRGFSEGGKEVLNLLANHGYTLEWEGLFQMSPMVDYFLQNRPMMVALVAFTSLFSLLLANKENLEKRLIIAGLIIALSFKFQFFGLVMMGVLVGLFLLTHKTNRVKQIATVFLFLSTFLLVNLPFFDSGAGQSSLLSLFKDNFRWGPWVSGKSFWWFLAFPFLNFGIAFPLGLLGMFLTFRKKKVGKNIWLHFFLYLLTLVTPFVCRFTIYEGDMFKFFYFLAIPQAVFAGMALVYLGKRLKHLPLKTFLVSLMLVIVGFASLLTLTWSFLNRFQGYTLSDYELGLWLRENTPKGSVVLSYPGVHSPIDQIGGRLRVLSYINWPYSHGFNAGEDNVFSRLADIEKFYSLEASCEAKRIIIRKYNIDYVLLGRAEKENFSGAEGVTSCKKNLELIYRNEDYRLFKTI